MMIEQRLMTHRSDSLVISERWASEAGGSLRLCDGLPRIADSMLWGSRLVDDGSNYLI